jgi:gamma-glutamyltranspeptidase
MRLLALLALLSLATAAPTYGTTAPTYGTTHKRTGGGGAVASEVAECSTSGVSMLKTGGNAVDAVRSPSFSPRPSNPSR